MIVLTEIQNQTGTINKSVELIDGALVKKASAQIYKAVGKTVRMELDEVSSYLTNLNSEADKAILLGVWSGGLEFDEYDIQKNSGTENPDEGLIARTKEYFKYANSGATSLMLLDIDGGSAHGNWNPAEIQDFILILETALKDALIGSHASERSNICHFIKPSSSAGVLINGSPYGSGAHIYIPVKNLTPLLLEKIFRFSWLNGFTSHLITEAGTVISRSIVDEAVKGPERLVFESDVSVLGDGLSVVDRPCIWKQGGVLDCELACQILDDYIIEYAQKWNLYKKDIEVSPAAILVRQDYIKRHTARLAESGVENAGTIIKSRISGILLSSDFLVKDDMSSVPVYDVLVDASSWNEVGGFRDPLEPDYGAGKAKLFTSDNRCALHSFAHGSQVYVLKFDSLGLEQWMKNCSDSELEDCFAAFLAQSEVTPIQEAKLHKEVSRRLGVAVSVVRTAAKSAVVSEELEVVVKLIDVEATHSDIAESMLNTFGQGHRVYGGSLYAFDKTIWNRQTDSSLVKKVGTEYDYCSRCKRASDYKMIVNYALETSGNIVNEWKNEYGFPCASGFYRVTDSDVVEEPYTKEHGARFKLGFNPDFKMETPLWDQFLTNIVNVRCFQQMIGLVLAGMLTPKLQMAGVMKGPGGVGKGTTQKVLTAMLPKDRVRAVKLHEMNDAKIAADLADCVANFIPEVQTGGKAIATEGFKMLTGGDQLRGRRRYSDSFYFKSNASHVVAVNDWPTLDSSGSEIERRLGHFIIEFVHNHKKVIENLDTQIIQHELPGVLAWAINGVRDWLRNGMDDEHSLGMFSGWTQSFDSVSLFLSECVDFEPRKKVLRAGLYAAYKKFCEESNYFPKKKGGFFDEVRKFKVVSEGKVGGDMCFKGLGLIIS